MVANGNVAEFLSQGRSCRETQVKRELTVQETSHQNGVVDYDNRVNFEIYQCLLADKATKIILGVNNVSSSGVSQFVSHIQQC